MPRHARLDLPNMPVHVIHRGVNRAACFFGDVDRRYYLRLLRYTAARRACFIHAYVLMTNHVHLLVTPAEKGALSAMMQDVGRSYVRVMNAVHGRTGTLWEGRFKSCIVESESYLLNCQRYIELNPVRAGIAAKPDEYEWSSYRHYAGLARNHLIVEHEVFMRLGDGPAARQAAYCELFARAPDPLTIQKIRASANAGAALGSEAFLNRVGRAVGRDVRMPRRGRPPKERRPLGG